MQQAVTGLWRFCVCTFISIFGQVANGHLCGGRGVDMTFLGAILKKNNPSSEQLLTFITPP